MNKALLHNKTAQAVLVALLAVCLLLTGTFAWYNITQTRTNVFTELVSPDVNLHDDFEGGPNKDVYVENSGNRPVYLRVRLGEYLQTDGRGSLVEGQVRDEEKARHWAPHNGSPTADLCTLADGNVNSPAWGDDSFHKYYKWVLGGTATAGQVYYKPATPEQKGEYDSQGTMLREPVVVSDPNTALDPHRDAHLLYAEQLAALTDIGKTEAEAMAELGLEKTQTAAVITMEQWISGKGAPTDSDYRAPMTKGNYWVMETDGWCYWAAPLDGGSATGLLLDKVERTGEAFDSTAEYAINVWLQAVDEADLGELWAVGNGGITENGKKLIDMVAGNLVLDQNGDEYIDNDNGSFTPKPPEGGGEVPAPAPFVPLVTPTVDVPEAQRLHIGQRFTVGELLWDGTDYTNWAAEAAKQAPYYNITPIADADTQANLSAGKAVYQATGSERGWDGNIYLTVAPVKNEAGEFITDLAASCYLASLQQSTADSTDNRAANLPDSYRKVYPGNGPYAFIWANAGTGGIVGLPGDTVENPELTIGGRYFYQQGSGVYIEVAAAGETVSKETPVKYFFPGRALSKTMLDTIPGEGDSKVDNVFPLQLTVGERFDLTATANGSGQTVISTYTSAADGKYTMAAPVVGKDSRLYLDLGGNSGYIGVGSDAFMGNSGDIRIWPNEDGLIGTVDDSYQSDAVTILQGRYFAHLGNGAYVEVSSLDDTVSKDTPEIYYFATKKLGGVEGGTVNDTFLLQLTKGAAVWIYFAKSNVQGETLVNDYNRGSTTYTISGVVRGADGRYYIELGGASGYLGVGGDNFLGNAGDVRMWAGSDDRIGTPDDIFNMNMPIVGATVTYGHYPQTTADGSDDTPVTWKVLKIDGNRALLISEYALDAYQLERTYVPWQDGPLRKYMNGDNKDTTAIAAVGGMARRMFTDGELRRVVPATIGGQNSDMWNETYNPSRDRLFAIGNSTESGLLQPAVALNSSFTTYGAAQLSKYTNPINNAYWGRVGVSTSYGYGAYNYLLFGTTGGNLHPTKLSTCGIRPMMWLDYST